MSTFGVHYRTGSPGQLGLRVAGFPGHWVAGSQNVTQFHLCCPRGAQQQTHRTPLLRSIDGTDGQTDGRTTDRYTDPAPLGQCQKYPL